MSREPRGAVGAAGLLVGGAGEQHVAAEAGDRVAGRVQAGGPGAAGEQDDDHRLHRDHALHVHGAAAPDVAVGDVGANGPWVQPSPAFAGTTSRCERRSSGSPPVPSPRRRTVDGAAPGDGLDDLGVQALGAQDRGDEARRVRLRARRVRRVDRRDADQVPEELHQLVVGGVPRGGVEGFRGQGSASAGHALEVGGHGPIMPHGGACRVPAIVVIRYHADMSPARSLAAPAASPDRKLPRPPGPAWRRHPAAQPSSNSGWIASESVATGRQREAEQDSRLPGLEVVGGEPAAGDERGDSGHAAGADARRLADDDARGGGPLERLDLAGRRVAGARCRRSRSRWRRRPPRHRPARRPHPGR